MDFWKYLVMGTIKINCNRDYDKVHNIAKEHKTMREFLGHTIYAYIQSYGPQTIKDNTSLLTSQMVDETNQIVVTFGHEVDWIDVMILPKKSKLSETEKQVEFSEEFIEARQKHTTVESAINVLENHGFDRCLDCGLSPFKRYVALVMLARNIQIVGASLRKKSFAHQRGFERLAA